MSSLATVLFDGRHIPLLDYDHRDGRPGTLWGHTGQISVEKGGIQSLIMAVESTIANEKNEYNVPRSNITAISVDGDVKATHKRTVNLVYRCAPYKVSDFLPQKSIKDMCGWVLCYGDEKEIKEYMPDDTSIFGYNGKVTRDMLHARHYQKLLCFQTDACFVNAGMADYAVIFPSTRSSLKTLYDHIAASVLSWNHFINVLADQTPIVVSNGSVFALVK